MIKNAYMFEMMLLHDNMHSDKTEGEKEKYFEPHTVYRILDVAHSPLSTH